MTETNEHSSGRPPVDSLIDFVYGDDDKNLEIEVAVREDGRVAVFHNRPFRNELSWLEFDLTTNELFFVLDDGAIRDAGLPLGKDVAKNMQNSHQVLMILLDDETGEAKEGFYIPLIIHQS